MKKILIIFILLILFSFNVNSVKAAEYTCGQTYQAAGNTCNCAQSSTIGYGYRCCGYYINNVCLAAMPTSPPVPTSPAGSGIDDTGVTEEVLNGLNPLQQESPLADELSTPAGIINRALGFIFPIAGFILFIMIVWGGFEMMTGAVNKKSVESGKQRVTSAIIGFMLLFASYWIVQLIERVFGINILGK